MRTSQRIKWLRYKMEIGNVFLKTHRTCVVSIDVVRRFIALIPSTAASTHPKLIRGH